jgi:ferredoxin-nitrite reductase
MATNKIEELKRAKDGLDVLPDLYRYAREGFDAIPADDLERLKWYGLFHRKATPGFFMLRLRIPNGVLTSEQAEAIGEIAERCGRGQADITTRQNIQLRWITIEDAPWVMQRLTAAGLTSQQSGMDNVRNIVGCPLAGLDADEAIDARGLAARLQQAIVGRRDFSNLPRKFNLSITGCLQDCAHAQTNDLSFVPACRTAGGAGEVGFNVLVGGALGGQHPALAEPLDVFVPPGHVVRFATALIEVFRDHGLREKRQETRLKWLLADWGTERLREAVEGRLGVPLARAGTPLTARAAGDHIGVTQQRQAGLDVVGLLVPVGRITGEQLIELARLAERYGEAELRFTVQQNVLIPHVSDEHLDALLAEPLLRTFSPHPSPFLRGLVSCTGMDFCHFSLIDTKGEALRLARALDERYEVDAPVRINMSGCPHACGQHRAAEIGLQGDRVRVDGAVRHAAHLFAGGRLGADARLAEPLASGVLVEALPDLVAEQIAVLRGPDAIRRRTAMPASSVAGD